MLKDRNSLAWETYHVANLGDGETAEILLVKSPTRWESGLWRLSIDGEVIVESSSISDLKQIVFEYVMSRERESV